MKNRNILIIILLAVLCTTTSAQKVKGRATKKQKTTAIAEETPAQKLYRSMLPATARVMFIDSVVTDKAKFLRHVPLNSESGSLTTYDEFFNTDRSQDGVVFQNEFRSRCYYADGGRLMTMDRVGEKWALPQVIEGIDAEFAEPDYPFMMADGITLYFAAKGPNSIGGYDIFTTLFDSESNQFYKPENYGLPFNSTANDYLLAIDDLDTLGWLVSDRGQPEDKVCIYTFVPVSPRVSLNSTGITGTSLERYARLACIEDTWQFGNREQAMDRLRRMMKRTARKQMQEEFIFVVNDEITYYRLTDFRSASARELYVRLASQRKALANREQMLGQLRAEFHTASDGVRRGMREDILSREQRVEQLRMEIIRLEKEVRNTENRALADKR